MGATIVPGTGSRRAYYPKYKINQGPFSGGMNTVDDPTSLGQNELQDCINFLAKPDGTLRPRPPVDVFQTGLPTPTGSSYTLAMGSVVQRTTGKLVPVISITDLTTGTDFYYYNGATWTPAFAHKAQAEVTSPTGSTGVFTKVWLYNNMYYVLSSSAGLYSTTGLGTALTYIGAAFAISGKQVAGYDGVVVKNRLIVSDGENLFWSKATDPANWTTPNAGVLLTNSSDGDQIRNMIVFQNDIWVMKNNGVYRWSWTTDPSTDGTYEQISSDGAYDCAVYNSDLYIINGNGVYKLVSSFFQEVSVKIRNKFRLGSKNLNYTGIFSPTTTVLNKIGLFKMGSYLLCGPFNTIVPFRFGEASVDNFVGNAYWVLDMDTGVWAKWQMSAYSVANSIAGPVQDMMYFSQNNPAAPDSYVWVGASTESGAHLFPYVSGVYTMDATELATEQADTLLGVDTGIAGSSWIGGLLKLGSINLGDSTMWKRVFTSALDAVYSLTPFQHGNSQLGYIADGTFRDVNIVSGNRLKFGKAFRCKQYAMYYDSITAIQLSTALPATTPELSKVNEFFSWVQISEKVTT